MSHPHAAGRRGASRAAIPMLLAAVPAAAQRQSVSANWALANRFGNEQLRRIVHSTSVNGRWINETDSLWYRWEDAGGARFMLAVPKSATKRPLFDHARLAAELSRLHGKPYDATTLPFQSIDFQEDGRRFRFRVDSTRYEYDLGTAALTSLGIIPRCARSGRAAAVAVAAGSAAATTMTSATGRRTARSSRSRATTTCSSSRSRPATPRR